METGIFVKRLKVCFSGRVQGVGFRFTTERIAARFPVTGYVRNLPDGQVELVAEGEEEILHAFLKSIEGEMAAFIQQGKAQWQECEGTFKRFGITY